MLDLLVIATDGLVVDGETGTAQFGQDAVGELTETSTHVFDLLFAFLGVFIHRKNAQDDILVLDVRCGNELLETLPVLSGVVGLNILGKLGLLHLLLDITLGILLTLVSQFLVEGEATIG